MIFFKIKLCLFGFVMIFNLFAPHSAYGSQGCAANVITFSRELTSGVRQVLAGDTVFRYYGTYDEVLFILRRVALIADRSPFSVILRPVLPQPADDKADSHYIDFRVPPETVVTKVSDTDYLIVASPTIKVKIATVLLNR